MSVECDRLPAFRRGTSTTPNDSNQRHQLSHHIFPGSDTVPESPYAGPSVQPSGLEPLGGPRVGLRKSMGFVRRFAIAPPR